MSTNIFKNYTIHVGTTIPTLDNYWTMEESGIGPRVDKVHGDPLQPGENVPPGGMSFAAVPGKQGNAFNTKRTGLAFIDSQGWISNWGLSVTGSCFGASVAFWIKLSSAVGIPDYRVVFNIFTSGDLITLALQINNTTPHFLFVGSGHTWVLDGLISLPFDVWNFVHIFYSGCQVGISVNNGPENILGFTGVGGTIYYVYAIIENDTNDFINRYAYLDELAFGAHGKFTPTQIAYLYNGGAGRTWPIVLPP